MRRPISLMLLIPFFLAGPLAAVSGAGVAELGVPAFLSAAREDTANQMSSWLSRAPSPAPIACSVARDLAPAPVENFEKIAAKVSEIYTRIHEEVQRVSAGEVLCDPVNAATAALSAPETVSREMRQAAVTATYQSVLQEIETQRKLLSDYTEALRTDASIAGFSSRIQQTLILTRFGRDAYRLGEQLKAAGEGAALVLQQRLNATLK